MGNSFAHAVNVPRSKPHGQETCPSYNPAFCSFSGAETVAVPMHDGAEHPSRIILPIIDGDDAK